MSRRSTIALASVGTSVAFVGLASLVLTDGFFAEFLLDRNSRALPYPFTIQNVMWIVFFVGAGELLERWLQTDGEQLRHAQRAAHPARRRVPVRPARLFRGGQPRGVAPTWEGVRAILH